MKKILISSIHLYIQPERKSVAKSTIRKIYPHWYCFAVLKISGCGGKKIHGKDKILYHFNYVEKFIYELKFTVSYEYLTYFEEVLANLKGTSRKTLITPKLCEEFTQLIEELIKVIYSESKGRFVFETADLKFRNIHLIENPEKLLSKGCFSKLSHLGQQDFSEACICLAFGRSTASAFHSLRATEETLKRLYFGYVKRNRVELLMWGNMERALAGKRNPKPKKELLDNLSIIRNNYRNPTAHPEKIYNIDEAQNLLAQCIDVIERVMGDSKYSPINC